MSSTDFQGPQDGKSADIYAVDRPLQWLLNLNKTLLWVVVSGVFFVSTITSVLITAVSAQGSDPWTKHLGQSALLFSASFLVNLAAAATVYLISVAWFIPTLRKIESKQSAQDFVVHPLFRLISTKIDELKTPDIIEYKSKWDVKWNDEIGSATQTIDILVQGWDGLVKHHIPAWESFFKVKHGHVNLILPKIVKDSKTIDPIKDRMGRTRQKQVDEIQDTYRLLEKANKNADHNGTISLCSYEPMLWYCLIRIDTITAFLSCYEHIDGGGIESPFLKINLNRFPMVKDWIDKELKGVILSAPPTNEDPKLSPTKP